MGYRLLGKCWWRIDLCYATDEDTALLDQDEGIRQRRKVQGNPLETRYLAMVHRCNRTSLFYDNRCLRFFSNCGCHDRLDHRKNAVQLESLDATALLHHNAILGFCWSPRWSYFNVVCGNRWPHMQRTNMVLTSPRFIGENRRKVKASSKRRQGLC
jgi:hypothetical protein